MKIEVNIQAPEVVSALNNLAEALKGTPQVAKEDKPVKQESKKESKPKEENKEEKPKDEPKEDSKPKEESKEEKETASVPDPADLRAKAGELSKSGKKEEVKALLGEFEAKTLSAIPEDKRAEFLERLEEL